jgi:hypothetical protein
MDLAPFFVFPMCVFPRWIEHALDIAIVAFMRVNFRPELWSITSMAQERMTAMSSFGGHGGYLFQSQPSIRRSFRL